MSTIPDLFQSYLHSSNSIISSIEETLLHNGQTYYCDLEQVSEFNQELSVAIQQNYTKLKGNLHEIFDTFCTEKFDKKLDLSFNKNGINLRIREIKTEHLNKLVTFTGTVTRTSQVKPELISGTFVCRSCKTQIPNVLQQHKYTEPLRCLNNICTNRTAFDLKIEECTFSNWQKISVQEQNSEIPKGSLPRSIDVVVRNELCEQIRPGSHVAFTGYGLCAPDDPVRLLPGSVAVSELAGEATAKKTKNSIARELNFKLLFVCISYVEKNGDKNLGNENTPASVLSTIANTPDLYNKLANSLYPTIYGHQNIKNALLLMLVGGVSKQDDLKLRGDINVLLVGDPGTAKSQFLKQTSQFLSRSNYTSGKSSSAAGLTAAVLRDESGDYAIDAGALMLSDNGICCIDEFDKMTYKDQVSIHEAMEQQTISISKAGINATMNAKCSVLAAANPIRGRYDPKKSLKSNVNLSPAIMSRFDLYFVLIDKIDRRSDMEISKYILDVHGSTSAPVTKADNLFSIPDAIAYIKYVKNNKPRLTAEARVALEEKYVKIRQESLVNTNNYRMTVRHLESMIRLSEALAKIHNSDVTVQHIDEAYRLLKSSLVEIKSDNVLISNNINNDMVISMSKKEYSKIVALVVYLIKNEDGLSREELTVNYLKQIEQNIASEFELEEETTKLKETVEFMINNEGVLYEMDGKIHVHQSYDV